MKKNVICLLVCTAMTFSSVPAAAFAEEASAVTETGEKTEAKEETKATEEVEGKSEEKEDVKEEVKEETEAEKATEEVKEKTEAEEKNEAEVTETKKEPTSETEKEAEKTESTEPITENEQQTQLNGKMAEMYSVMAQSNNAVVESTVSMGSTNLENGGIYIPAVDEEGHTGTPAQYRVVDKFVPTEDEEVPESGNYVEYNNGILTVYGNVVFTSGGPSILNVASGTLTVTGGEDTSLTLNNGNSYAAEIGSSSSLSNLVLAGYVDFTAENTGDYGTAISINGDLKTAEGYSGDISISAKNNIVFYKCGGNSGIAQIDLKTSGSVKMGTNGSYPILSADSFLVEGSSVVLDAPNANPMLQVSGNLSITSTEGNLDVSSASESYAPIINSNKGTVTLSAPKGDITIKSAATGNSYPSQAISASNIIVKNTGNFTVNGKYVEAISAVKYAAGEQVKGTFTATNCHSVNIENTAENSQSAVSGNVNITGDGSEDGQAVFTSNGSTASVIGDTTIKNFGNVNITSSNSTAINSDNNVDIEDCGSVRISGKGSGGPAIAVSNNADFKNCKNIEISAEGAEAVILNGGIIAFENCDSVSVYNNATNRNAIAAYNGTTTFTGCKYVSVKTEGTGTSAIYGDKYTCDGRIAITEKGETKIIENGTEIAKGKDVTNTGLRLESDSMPNTETTYFAGGGTITFIPATETANAKLVLDNAEIEIDSFAAIDSRNNENLDIEINGTNTLCGSCGIRSAGSLNMYGSGTLTVDAKSDALSSERNIEINGGKFILSGESGISAQKNMTVNGGNISITASGSGDGIYVNEGDITINDGTLNINSKSTNVYGILSSNDVNEEVGNIYIHGGTVNINVVRHAMFSDRNIVIDGNAVVNAVGNDGGIYLSKGNLEISGNAKVNAIDGIRANDGNIIISGNANLTAESYGYEGICIKGTLEIRDNAVVSADGAGKNYDIVAEGGLTVSDGAKLNAFVQTGEEVAAYGICDSNDIASVKGTSSNKLHVAEGAEFTVTSGTSMEISDYANTKINGKVINKGTTIMTVSDVNEVPKGKIENNGQFGIDLSKVSADAQEVVRSMRLTGTGVVSVKTAESGFIVYSNDGTELKNVRSVDISGDASKGNLDTDGYYWDKDTNTLTLKDIMVSDINGRIDDDVTIKTEGCVNISKIQDITGGALTLTGDTLKISTISVEGNLVIENKIADIGIISNGNGNSRLTFLNTTSTVNSINWPDNGVYKGDSRYGVVLTNSNVTVGGDTYPQFFAGKIDMDDNSVLTLNKTPITNYGKYPNGLDGLKPYLPKNGGYKIDKYVSDMEDKPCTILDANGNMVDTIVLKKQSSGGSTGGNTGGGSSGGGSSAVYYKINVKSAENGKVELSKASALRDNVVTVTATADKGYELSKITVLNNKNEAVELTDKGRGEYEFKMPGYDVTVEAVFAKKATEEKKDDKTEENNESKSFADVAENAWYKEAVEYANSNGLMSGISDNEFGPALLTNRAMLVTILWRMEGSPSTNYAAGFTDINGDDYYYNAVLWAAENKIVSGVSETSFDPNCNITREQLAAILYRYAVYKGYDVSQGGMAIREFDDYEEISEYALTSLTWAVNSGIVSGKGNRTLDPKGSATRAETAAMLMRFCKNNVK